MSKNKFLKVILFSLYTIFVVWMTLLMREPRVTSRIFKPRLFWAFRDWARGVPFAKREAIQYLQNIVFFIPFGFLFPWKKNWRIVFLVSVSTASLIEVSQYIFNLGWCEIDDVISNTIGALIGFNLCFAVEKIYRKYRRGNPCRSRKY